MTFFAPGLPRAKGSMRAFVVKGRAIMTNASSATRPWEQTVRWYAQQAGLTIAEGPVRVALCFYMPRPRTVKREHPTTKPDLDKLTRAVLDALTGVAWKDDAQVTGLEAVKLYEHDAEECGVRVRVIREVP